MDDRWTEEKILKAIKHYQDSVHKYTKSGNNAKILHAIKRLYDLPITVKHLQETGVGRTINALRKNDGDVGHASRAIVQKWKNMVVEEEDDGQQEDEQQEDDGYDDDDELKEQEDEQEQKENLYRKDSDDEPTHKKKHKSRHNYNSEDSDNEIKNHKSSNEDKHKKHKHDSDKHKNHKHDKEKFDKYSKMNDSVSEHKSHKSDDSHRSSHSNSSNDKKHSKHDKEHKHKEREKNERKRKYEDESSSSSSKKKRYTSDNDDSEEQEIEENDDFSDLHKSQNDVSDRSPEQEEIKTSHKSSSSSSSSSKHKKSKKHKKEKPDRDPRKDKDLHNGYDENNTVNITKSNNPDKSHKKSSKDKSSSSKSSSNKESSSSKSNSNDNKEINKSNSKSSHHDDKSKKSEKCDKEKEKKKDKSVNKVKKGIITEDGIDCGSGASFAEALGMMEDVPTIRTTFTKKKSKPERNKSPEPSTSKVTSTNNNKPSTSTSTSKSSTVNPPLLSSNVKLEPLDIDISPVLPEITTNYKPLPVNYSYEFDTPMRPISHMTEEEALDYVITSKTQRTKVYSGVKTWRYVPSLFNLCVKVLQDHIDSLEYTGGVPYSILKPVLEKANTTQLFNAENHNPYLIEDTDELWELHCKKLFKGKQPQEMESWRDMYLRCCDEREAKLRSLTKNIKISQEKSLPVRQTKLAYVDSVVKPPRAIARKQAKYGTASANSQPLITPSSRLKDVAAPKSSNPITVPNPAPQRASSSSSGMMKPKKAPLMQKALAAIKSRFRR